MIVIVIKLEIALNYVDVDQVNVFVSDMFA